MTLMQLFNILRARAGLVLFVTLMLVGVAVALAIALPRRYDAVTGVVVEPMGAGAASDSGAASGRGNPADTQADIIASYGVAARVVDALGLTRRPDPMRLIAGGGPLHRLRVLAAGLIADERAEPGESLRDRLAGQLLQHLHVRSNGDSRVVKVTYSAPEPRFAAQVANAFVREYLASTAEVGTQPAERAAQLFDRQLAKLRDRLQKAEQRVSKFQQKTGIIATGAGLDTENARLGSLTSQLVTVQSRDYEARAKQRRLQRFAGAGAPESDVPPEVLDSATVQQARQQVVQAQADLGALSRRVGPNHPLYQAAETKLQRARSAYRSQMLSVARGLLANAGSAGEEVAALRGEMKRQRKKVLALKGAYAKLAVLRSEADSAREAYNAAAKRLAQTRIQGQAAQNASATVLYEATPPTHRSSPKVALMLEAALLGGIALGIGAALWAETADRRVRSGADIVELLGVPVLATLYPRARLGRSAAPRLYGPNLPRLAR